MFWCLWWYLTIEILTEMKVDQYLSPFYSGAGGPDDSARLCPLSCSWGQRVPRLLVSSCHVEFSAAWLSGATLSVTEFKNVPLQLNKPILNEGSETRPDLDLVQFTSGLSTWETSPTC